MSNALLMQIAQGGNNRPSLLDKMTRIEGIKNSQATRQQAQAQAQQAQQFNQAAGQYMSGDEQQRQSAAQIMLRTDPQKFSQIQSAINGMDEAQRKRALQANATIARTVAGIAMQDNSLAAWEQLKPQLEQALGRQLPDYTDEASLDQALRGAAVELGAETELLSYAFGKPAKYGAPREALKPDGTPGMFITDESGSMQWLDAQPIPKGEGGMTVYGPDGQPIVHTGGGKPMKLTEGQSKDLVYLTRGQDALAALDREVDGALLSDHLTDFMGATLGQLPVAGNYVKTQGYQLAEQAARNYLGAILRKDTGAAVTDTEFRLYGQIFLPVPGDQPETLAQKAQARRIALDAIKLGLGPAEILLKGQEALMQPPPTADQARDTYAPQG